MRCSIRFAHAEHHGRGSAHAKLMRCAMHVEPVCSEALETRNAMANFVIEDLRAASRNGIEPGIAQAGNRITNCKLAVFGDGNDLRR